MKKLILHPTDISQWYALIHEAQVSAQIRLDENIESYLVFLLQRFSQTPQLLESVMATDFLEAMQTGGKRQIEFLRAVGDKSLLLCGLFPGIATRRHVSIDYYTGMGRSAYLTISERQERPLSELYFQLSECFLGMQKILQSLRSEYHQIEPLHMNQITLNDDPHLH